MEYMSARTEDRGLALSEQLGIQALWWNQPEGGDRGRGGDRRMDRGQVGVK